jgi:hypothetical protein
MHRTNGEPARIMRETNKGKCDELWEVQAATEEPLVRQAIETEPAEHSSNLLVTASQETLSKLETASEIMGGLSSPI